MVRAIIIGLICLGIILPSVASGWVSPRSKKGPIYGIPFKPKWVSRVKKGKIIKYKRREFSSPVVSGDRVFVGADSGYFYAMTLEKGKKKWRFKASGPINSTPAVAEGKVFFGDDDGQFYALDTESGELIWTRRFRAPVMAAPLPVGGRLYGVTLIGTVFALDPGTGSLVWTHPAQVRRQEMTLYGHSAPAYDVVGRQGRLYIGLADGRLLALSAADGRRLWEKSLATGRARLTDIDMSPVSDGNHLYVATFAGDLFCLRKQDGQVVWQVAIGSGAGFAVSKENIYLSGSEGVLHALNKLTGEKVWTRDLGKGALSKPVLYKNLIAVASTERSILFVDARNGHFVMQRFARKDISSDPILAGADGNLLVYLSNGGRLYALALKDEFRIK